MDKVSVALGIKAQVAKRRREHGDTPQLIELQNISAYEQPERVIALWSELNSTEENNGEV